jgi:hypothetical protein
VRGADDCRQLALSGTIEAVASALSDHLVPATARDRIQALAARLPAVLSDHLYLECRLGSGRFQVDLSMRVDRDGARVLAGSTAAAIGRELAERPLWRRAARVARRWLKGPRPGQALSALWLEIDLPEESESWGAGPRLFFEWSRGWMEVASAREQATLALELAKLAGAAPPPLAVETLTGLIEQLEAPACLRYLGCDPARPGAALRLCLARLDRARLARLGDGSLRQMGACWASLLEELRAPATPLVLNLDLGERGVGEGGLELTFERGPQLRGELRERAWLEALVARGLCSPLKRTGLLCWPGHRLTVLNHQIWRSLLWRRLNHIKLRALESGGLEAKAYLAFGHRFFQRPQ